MRKGLGSAGEWTVRRQNDLDALERNIKKMGDYAKAHGTRHRVHSKMHKSVDVAKLQEKLGGAVGVCCQKVSEAEVFARGGIKDILVSNEVRDPAKIERLAKLGSDIIVSVDDLAKVAELSEVAAQAGLPFEAVELDSMGEADVIISITSAFSPSLMAKHVSEGTHIACMGTDTKGKQEVEAALLAKARVFTNEVAQSITIGEAQHAVAEGLISEADITTIGAVINGTHPGRSADSDITLFDGTGVGLQDLAVAAAVVDLAVEKGIAIEIDF
ncbi:alanine racemase [Fulvimarina manganoxydans]|uniref:alanine racemase n=1 Tax=Fulvimarina manganoxydans TaxID=937218 RepID=UPI001FCCE746|nr:alanine racemase [Fulvimarina manganoxydans]